MNGAIEGLEDLLLSLGATAAHREVGDKIREIVAEGREIAETEGTATGALSLKLTFAFEGRAGKCTVRYAVDGKTPQRPREATTLYALKDGTLSATDPRQPELPRVRSAPTTGIKTPRAHGATAKTTTDDETT